MKILALDLGTRTGWAFGDTDSPGRLHHGVQDFSLKRGESPGMRFLRFDRWMFEMIMGDKPDMIIYEMPHHRGGHATAVLSGLVGILLKVCAESKIEHMHVHSATLKKFATGSGRASKGEMVQQVFISYRVKVIDDNEADAIHMWHYADEVEV
jgi:Holliday junction resolvasome RuvABC endonuclease subunit